MTDHSSCCPASCQLVMALQRWGMGVFSSAVLLSELQWGHRQLGRWGGGGWWEPAQWFAGNPTLAHTHLRTLFPNRCEKWSRNLWFLWGLCGVEEPLNWETWVISQWGGAQYPGQALTESRDKNTTFYPFFNWCSSSTKAFWSEKNKFVLFLAIGSQYTVDSDEDKDPGMAPPARWRLATHAEWISISDRGQQNSH